MTKDRLFRVYLTQTDDGSWLAASVAKPWFCLSAETEDAARAKAQRAVDFWCESTGLPLNRQFTRSVAPFAPRSVETLRVAACA